MRARKVRLYLRIRISDGRYIYADPVWNQNRTLRSGYALVEKKPKHHPEGCYYLRYVRCGKRSFIPVGPHADAAIAALRNAEHEMHSISLGLKTADPAQEILAPVSLSDAITTYLEDVRRFRAPKTIAASEQMLTVFLSSFPQKAIKDITRKDLLSHMTALKNRGLADRTIYNHIMRIGTLLKANGKGGLLSASDKPHYEEKEVEAYNSSQLETLFAAAGPEERILFEFFLATGLREQEVMHTTWGNIDFKSKLITVRSKPEWGFRIKDKEERSVPVPDALLAALATRRKQSASMLVFPGPAEKPNGHFLRLLQKLALRAGLNCGECRSKQGNLCKDRPSCRRWGLHKFRKTFATMHSEAGVPVTKIQKWLGHSDLATTLRYLAVADLRSERTRSQVNTSFACLNLREAA